MDAFFASIEQRDRPELRGKPVIVGGSQPRGVVAAASYEARRFGVHSAMPGFEARRRCPQGVFLQPDMQLYSAVSAEVHRVFEEFTPEIEPIALDEAFLDVTGSLGLFGGDAARLGAELKRRVRDATNLTVSVGIGENKLVAKIACRLGKPDGLRIIPVGTAREVLAPLPVRSLWGVGPVLAEKLVALGIRRVGELADAPLDLVRVAAADRAPQLVALARGIDARVVVADREPKSIGEESTFAADVSDAETAHEAIVAHAEAVARRLRRAGYLCSTITLKMKLGRARTAGGRSPRVGAEREPDYPLLTRQRRLTDPTDDAQVIAATARGLWDEARLPEAVRLIGVSGSGLVPASSVQLDLFAPRRPRVGVALDAIQARFGEAAIGRAVKRLDKGTPTMRRTRGD